MVYFTRIVIYYSTGEYQKGELCHLGIFANYFVILMEVEAIYCTIINNNASLN